MIGHVRANLLLLGLTLVVCSVLYPLAVLAIGQGLFPATASGSVIAGPGGKPVGSRLIAQKFAADEWFHPRPSAADYNASASAGSNLGANNPKLRDRVEETLKSRRERSDVPADAVTASGSGLDPHITRKNADGQLDRVVGAWASKSGMEPTRVRTQVVEILDAAAFAPLVGLAGGDPLVNVLEVNLELHRRFASPGR